LPDVPSISEGGLAFEQTVWFALFAPAGTPAAVLERLNREVGEILKDPAVIEKIAATGATAASSTAPELKNFVVAEVDKWNKVAKESGAKAD
jgi:tripartite-type tricarboxylate transporter receptor subunit TctC